MPGPPLISAVTGWPANHPFTGVTPVGGTSEMPRPPLLASRLARKLETLLLLTATLPEASTTCTKNSASSPTIGPPPHQRVDPSGRLVATRSTPVHAPF